MRQNLYKVETRTWMEPPQEIDIKMVFFRDNFLHIAQDVFILCPDVLSRALR